MCPVKLRTHVNQVEGKSNVCLYCKTSVKCTLWFFDLVEYVILSWDFFYFSLLAPLSFQLLQENTPVKMLLSLFFMYHSTVTAVPVVTLV